MEDFTIGKHILESLTTGMYKDPLVMYREYIQNACDAIDAAVKKGLAQPEELGVAITIDSQMKEIIIADNGAAIPAKSFRKKLGDIANSDKKVGESKGFRGIGRMCGLGYCKHLEFRSKAVGENTESVMEIDAEMMHKMLDDKEKRTAQDVWAAVCHFHEEKSAQPKEDHFFRVYLKDVDREADLLLDQEKVKKYLRSVAPVPYDSYFYEKGKIEEHLKAIQPDLIDSHWTIDEYSIKVNGEAVCKGYKSKVVDSNEKTIDEIDDLGFCDFKNAKGKIYAWLWYGINSFKKQLPEANEMRGIRIRSGNIQIGDANALQSWHKEPRGNYYFVGELFTVDGRLKPNSQRDGFESNEVSKELELEAKEYFRTQLYTLYRKASEVSTVYKRINQAQIARSEYEEKKNSIGFLNPEDQKKEEDKVAAAEEEARKAEKKLNRIKANLENNRKTPLGIVITSVIRDKEKHDKDRKNDIINHTPPVSTDSTSSEDIPSKTGKTKTFMFSDFSWMTKRERKLLGRACSIMKEELDRETADHIIDRIRQDLQQGKNRKD